MYYCFIAEDLDGLANDPLIIQKNYAERLNALCIASLTQQTVLSPSGDPVILDGKKVLLRCTNDNLSDGIQLLLKFGAELIETQDDISQIENWHKLGITRRKIYELSISDLMKNLPAELTSNDALFVKSKSKGFSAVINPKKLIQREQQVMDFLKNQNMNSNQILLLSKFIQMRTDSLGTRETRHVVLNNQLVNSSRLLHSLKHTVPKSHKNKAQEIVKQVEAVGTFPSNYILDLGEFTAEEDSYLDVVEFNPLSCSMCFVNNSIFEIAVPEITEIKKRLQIGFEFCYDAISYPKSYDLMRASNRNYTYFSEERYSFL